MNIQRLRSLTTGILHTKISDIYEDIEFLIGETGIMTHQIPNAMRALRPWLREKVHDVRFWDGKFDTSHTGDFPIEPMPYSERQEFFQRYSALPNPLKGKEVIVVEMERTVGRD